MRIEDCIPKNKFDTGAIENAVAVGYPALNPILPALLEWTQDANWPVADNLFDLLSKAGPEITPYLTETLNNEDEQWKYFVLTGLIRGLHREVADLLKADIVRIVHHPTMSEKQGDIDEVVRGALLHWGWQAT